MSLGSFRTRKMSIIITCYMHCGYCLAVNLVDREIETFLLNFGNKTGNLRFGAVQYCCAEKLFPNMLP